MDLKTKKRTIKIHFKMTNHILEDDVIYNSWGGIGWVIDVYLLNSKWWMKPIVNHNNVVSKVLIMKKILIDYFWI